MHIVTVIPTFNRKAHLAQVLRDFQAQEGMHFSEAEENSPPTAWHHLWENIPATPKPRLSIVVVDDGCTDGKATKSKNKC
jgi:glycosyltransferase involved in cell wall biosynthesis